MWFQATGSRSFDFKALGVAHFGSFFLEDREFCCKCEGRIVGKRVEAGWETVTDCRVRMAYNGFSLLVPEAMESKSMIKRQVEKFRRPVWLRRVCYTLCLVALAAIAALVGFQPNLSTPILLLHSNFHSLCKENTKALP